MIVFQLGRRFEALDLLRKSVRQSPGNPNFRSNLGGILVSMDMDGEALEHLEEALHLRPDFAQAMVNMGIVLERLQRSKEAVSVLMEAVRLAPEQPPAHTNLALSLLHDGDCLAAEAICRQAICKWPGYSVPHDILGLVLTEQRRIVEATEAFTRAIAIDPRSPDAHANLGIALLAQGQWQRGWKEFEWRRHFKPQLQRPGRTWAGEDLAGKTILLYSEGGLGNTIQFARYIPILADMGAKVIFQCHPRLFRFLGTLRGIWRFHGNRVLPKYDLYCPLMSVPAILSQSVSPIPAEGPYLHANDERIAHWCRYLRGITGLRIGVCWQGEQRLVRRRNRSIPLTAFASLAAGGGTTLVSLHRNASTESAIPLVELPGLDDGGAFVDTAAVMKSLDLVVTCDTSIAHVAGATGVPVWVALPCSADWCWQIDRHDTPWYPNMRLFRLGQAETWHELFERMARALAGLAPRV
jgi:Flp pilus assembly protein TadD